MECPRPTRPVSPAAPPQIKGITIVFSARYDTSHESHVYYYLAANWLIELPPLNDLSKLSSYISLLLFLRLPTAAQIIFFRPFEPREEW